MYTLEKLSTVASNQATKYVWAIPYKCNICYAVYYSCKICSDSESKRVFYKRSRLACHNTHHIGYNKEMTLKRKIEVVNEIHELIDPNSLFELKAINILLSMSQKVMVRHIWLETLYVELQIYMTILTLMI